MKSEKEFDAVKMARDIKDKIDKKITGMSKEEFFEYLRKGREEYIRTVGEPAKEQSQTITHNNLGAQII